MPDTATTTRPAPIIDLPRLPGERSERYEARVAYVTAGPNRSLRDLAQALDKSLTIVGRWSSEDDWPRYAHEYDEALTYITLREAEASYKSDLEAHRRKAMDAGRSLFVVAGQLLQQVNAALAQPKRIRGEDGKMYTLHGIELNSSSLRAAAQALTAALDLEAHALGVEKLLPALTNDDRE